MDMQRLFVRRVFRGEDEIAVNSLELRFQHGSRQVEDNAPVPAVSQAEPRGPASLVVSHSTANADDG